MSFNVEQFLKYFNFRRIKRRGENYMASCPDFSGKHSRGDIRPSFGIRANPPYLANCFTCGLRLNIEYLTAMLLSEKLERPVNPYEAWKWLEDKGWVVTLTAEDLRERLHSTGGDSLDVLNDNILLDFTNGVHKSILKRGITQQSAKEWELRYDPKTRRTIIPVRNFMGLLVGILSRAVDEDEYIRHGVGIPQPDGGVIYGFKKGLVLYGEHKVSDKNTVLLMESPLDVVYCWSHNIQADMDILALMGTMVSTIQIEKLLDYQQVILAMDNDKAGQEGIEQIQRSIGGKVDLRVFDNFGKKDIGKLNPEDLSKIKEYATSALSNRLQKIPKKFT